MKQANFADKAIEIACYYQNRVCEQDEIIEMFCMDAVIEPERIRADERERCAMFVESMTARSRKLQAALNSTPIAKCPIAMAIRML